MTADRPELPQDDRAGGALDDIAYLARSTNRIRLLEALAAGPQSRRDLDDATDASVTTLGRILSEFEQRDWARRRPDGDYEATSVGRNIADEFIPLVGSVAAIRQLGEAVDWLPKDDLSIGLDNFSDATVRRPERGDPIEIVDEFVELLRSGSRFAVLTDLVPPEPIATASYEEVVDGNLSTTVVTSDEAIQYAMDNPDRLAKNREMIAAGAEMYRYGGSFPCTLFVFDEVVWVKQTESVGVHPSYGVPIETTNDTVRDWALETIESYKREADRITLDWFPEELVDAPADASDH